MRALLSTIAMTLVACGARPAEPAHASRPAHDYRELEQATEPAALAPETPLSAFDVDADLDLFAYALDRGYGGRGFVPEESWAAMMARLEALRGKATDVSAFCDGIGDAVWEIPDAHLSARRGQTKCGKAFVIAKRAPRVGVNHAGDAKIWATDTVTLPTGAKVGVVSIKQFPFNEDPIWSSFDTAIRETMKHEGIIIDLRGNDGGDDSRGYELARALIDGEVVDGPLRMHERQTPETLTLWMNTVSAQRSEDGTLPPHVLARLNEAKAARDAALHAGNEWKVTESTKRVVQLGPHAFGGPIAILVDAGCKSSCESSLVVLRGHPKARVFGERTGGFIHFGNLGRVTLPHSRVRVNIPTKYDEFPGGKLYDKIGFEPDVALPPGSDAFAMALEWIAKNVSRGS